MASNVYSNWYFYSLDYIISTASLVAISLKHTDYNIFLFLSKETTII